MSLGRFGQKNTTWDRADQTKLAGRIRQVRHHLYGSRGTDALAKELCVPAHALADYERGKPIPGRVFLRFIDVTGVNARWLFTGDGDCYVAERTDGPAVRQS